MSRGRPGAHEQGYDQDAVGHLGHDEIDEVGFVEEKGRVVLPRVLNEHEFHEGGRRALLNVAEATEREAKKRWHDGAATHSGALSPDCCGRTYVSLGNVH